MLAVSLCLIGMHHGSEDTGMSRAVVRDDGLIFSVSLGSHWCEIAGSLVGVRHEGSQHLPFIEVCRWVPDSLQSCLRVVISVNWSLLVVSSFSGHLLVVGLRWLVSFRRLLKSPSSHTLSLPLSLSLSLSLSTIACLYERCTYEFLLISMLSTGDGI